MTLSSKPRELGSANNGMLKHRKITLERVEKWLVRGMWEAVNINAVVIKQDIALPAGSITVFSVPNFDGSIGHYSSRIPFAKAKSSTSYLPTKQGTAFGPTWSTHWFHVKFTIPSVLDSQRVSLIWDPECEAMIWSAQGDPLQGITGGSNGDRHVDFPLGVVKAGAVFEFYIENGCNGMFGAGAGWNGSIHPPENDRQYTLKTASLRVINTKAEKLKLDVDILYNIVKEAPEDSQQACDALYCANAILNTFTYDDPASLDAACALADKYFACRIRHEPFAHSILAIGNCHIDTAWLWPYEETMRKCARSWSTQCGMIEQYPNYTFAASQAQQFEWVEQMYPELFCRMTKHVKTGKFIPIGGTWTEMDCNIPSGESFVRQFLYGQSYFKEKFGSTSKVFWLPDTFGYSAQLPQIMKSAGLEYFFTQKLSWNNINTFPHSTFYWKGLDGTSVLTHFSPADTYTAQASIKDVFYAVKNNKDKCYSNSSLLVYGNGDGGGGPLVPMIERIQRMSSCAALPASVSFGDPEDFFRMLEEKSRDLNTWKGELYFELHRGTYTTHAAVKKGNRTSEYLLRQVEVLSCLNSLLDTSGKNGPYPQSTLDELWKLVLLNQFHDVLPGTSIEIAYETPKKYYEKVSRVGNQLKESAFQSRLQLPSLAQQFGVGTFNSVSFARSQELVEIPWTSALEGSGIFTTGSGESKKALIVLPPIPAFSTCKFTQAEILGEQSKITAIKIVEGADASITLTTKYLRVRFDAHGRLESLYDRAQNRESVPVGSLGNLFKYYEDIPLFWDAWDIEAYHLEKGWDAGVGKVSIQESGSARVVLRVVHPLSKSSSMTMLITVTAVSPLIEFDCAVDWNESRRVLKVEFPWNIACDYATYETQFGYIQRPTHYNTSWDMARFEVCGHKYVDYSEHGYGITLLNDCKFGFAVHDSMMRMTLIRSPKAPDAHADIGMHTFRYALYPHAGTFHEAKVVGEAMKFNIPVQVATGDVVAALAEREQHIVISHASMVLDTFKWAHKGGDKIVLRLYESMGSRGKCSVKFGFPVRSVRMVNVLEEEKDDASLLPISAGEREVAFDFSPFALTTLLVAI